MSIISYGKILIIFIEKILDWCATKINSTSDDYLMQIISLICVIYNKNSNFINKNASYFKSNKILNAYNNPNNHKYFK